MVGGWDVGTGEWCKFVGIGGAVVVVLWRRVGSGVSLLQGGVRV